MESLGASTRNRPTYFVSFRRWAASLCPGVFVRAFGQAKERAGVDGAGHNSGKAVVQWRGKQQSKLITWRGVFC